MFEIGLTRIHQHEDTAGPGNDEPYVIVFAADLADTGLIPVPAAASTLNGPFEIGGVIGFPVSTDICWGFDGRPRDIDDANNPLILVALLESDHDDSPPDFANSVRTGTHGLVMAALSGYIVDRNAGNLSLADLRSRLIDDMRGAVDIFRQADIENDERLGPIQRLPITAQDLVDAQTGTVEKTLTFVSSAEDSNYELTFSIGTGVGSVSSGLSSSGPTDRYAAIWTKQSGPQWVARHRMTSDEYQGYFDKFTGDGYRLVDVSGYNYGGQAQFAAIWEKSDGPEWVARHDMTSDEYQQVFDKLTQSGHRLVRVSAYRSGGEDRYAAIWRKQAGSEWIARHRMTSSQYQDEFNSRFQEGFRLADVSGCGIGGQERYAAIWEKRQGSAWVARHGMRAAVYQREFDRWTRDGYRLTHVSGTTIGGDRRFAAIWEKSSGPPWVARHNMTSEQYQQAFENYVGQGYRLTCVSGY